MVDNDGMLAIHQCPGSVHAWVVCVVLCFVGQPCSQGNHSLSPDSLASLSFSLHS